MKFVPRLTMPESGNPYYNKVQDGGYSECIYGSPTQPGCKVLSNCSGYAAGRFAEEMKQGYMSYYKHAPNAEQFWDQAPTYHLRTGSTPKLGAIICWEGLGSRAGHVAVVEQINADGSIVTSESGYNAKKPFWTTKRYKGTNGNWGADTSIYKFRGFIYSPITFDGVDDSPTVPASTIKKGMKGSDVKWLQQMLKDISVKKKDYAMYDPGNIDGDFGDKTERALVYFQFRNKLTIDGVCGQKTKSKLIEVKGG